MSISWVRVERFLSTLPARGATKSRAGRSACARNFYPRSPRGERPKDVLAAAFLPKFLSTLPARGATVSTILFAELEIFLSTLPARGAT